MEPTICVEPNTALAALYLKLLQSTGVFKARPEQAIEDALTSELQKHVAQPMTRQAFTVAVTGDGAD